MKRTTVTLKIRDPFGLGIGWLDRVVQGYECEIAGVPLVVHRTSYTDEKERRDWTVTEPITGGAVATSTSREKAIQAAEEVVAEKGGAEAVHSRIAALTEGTARLA
jgi:hypothetical protein